MPDVAPDPDDDLIERIAGGDRDAFAQLYRRYRPDVFRFASHMCGSRAPAEDVVQDVFIAVIEDSARYRRGRSGALPWLLGVARNHVRRWRDRRPVLPLPADETVDGRRVAAETDPIGDLTRERNQAALARALMKLPVRYREAIVLCDLQEVSYEDAAIALGCAIGTVRSRLHRGRARLAHELCGMEHNGICRLTATKPL